VALGIFAALLLGALVHVLLVSQVSFARSQALGFDQLRLDLARGTAPVSQGYVKRTPIDPMDAAADEPTAAASDTPTQPGTEVVSGPYLLPGGTPVALLSVPRLGIDHLVVVEGTTPGDTEAGPGHLRQSVFPGQAGQATILGRRWAYGAPFAAIDTLVRGDHVLVTTGQGVHDYVVMGARRPGDPIPSRQPAEGRLTLVTADGPVLAPDGPVYVDALLTTASVPSSRVYAVPQDLNVPPMGTDSGAWVPILLWLQGLTGASLLVALMWRRWGRPQAWIVGLPVLLGLGIGAANAAVQLLPNLL
jgi:hypothetical protein